MRLLGIPSYEDRLVQGVNYVMEEDNKGFFDNVDHDWLIKFLEHDIADKNVIGYIMRFLIAGVSEGTWLQDRTRARLKDDS